MEREDRTFATVSLQVEQREGKAARLIGHAAVFNQLSENLGGFREQIAPGAFAEAIEKDNVALLFNHDPSQILARTVSKNLRLSEDSRGLVVDADVDESDPDWTRLLAKMKRGDVSQMSFGFSVRPGGQDWAKDDEGQVIRTLKKVRLFDVSPVTNPAYPQTDVAVRELRAWLGTIVPPVPATPRLLKAREQQAAA